MHDACPLQTYVPPNGPPVVRALTTVFALGAPPSPVAVQALDAEVAGCADFSSGPARRLRLVRATGWSLLPPGLILALTVHVPDGDLRKAKATTGLRDGLAVAGPTAALTSGPLLDRRCRGVATFADRRIRRMRWAGWSILAAGGIGTMASPIALAAHAPEDDAGDYSPGNLVLVGSHAERRPPGSRGHRLERADEESAKRGRPRSGLGSPPHRLSTPVSGAGRVALHRQDARRGRMRTSWVTLATCTPLGS